MFVGVVVGGELPCLPHLNPLSPAVTEESTAAAAPAVWLLGPLAVAGAVGGGAGWEGPGRLNTNFKIFYRI